MSSRRSSSDILKKRPIMIILVLVILLFDSSSTFAGELSLKEALEWGKEHSFELRKIRDNIESIKRKIDGIKAGLDWQVRFSSNHTLNGEGSLSPIFIDYEDSLELKLSGNKTYLSGLSLNSEISLTEKEPFEFDDLEEKIFFKAGFSKQIYPTIPVEAEREIERAEKNLKAARVDLVAEIKRKEVDWLEAYLNLICLQERLKLANEGYQLAQRNLNLVQQQQAIAEAGEEQVLTARVRLKETELQRREAENSFLRSKQEWLQDLGLTGEQWIDLSIDDSYLQEIKERLTSLSIDFTDEQGLNRLLRENNLQLKKIAMDIELAKRELKWQQEEGKVQLTVTGGYGYQDDQDDWQVGVELSYNLLDGGKQEIAEEDKQAYLDSREEEYRQTLKELKLQLSDLLEQLKIARLNLESKKLALEKAKLEESSYKKQLDKGLISPYQYRQKMIENRQVEVDFKAACDRLFISRLRLLNFIGIY